MLLLKQECVCLFDYFCCTIMEETKKSSEKKRARDVDDGEGKGEKINNEGDDGSGSGCVEEEVVEKSTSEIQSLEEEFTKAKTEIVKLFFDDNERELESYLSNDDSVFGGGGMAFSLPPKLPKNRLDVADCNKQVDKMLNLIKTLDKNIKVDFSS